MLLCGGLSGPPGLRQFGADVLVLSAKHHIMDRYIIQDL